MQQRFRLGLMQVQVVQPTTSAQCWRPPLCGSTSTDLGLSQKSAQFLEGDHFIIPTAKFDEDYTIYYVMSNKTSVPTYPPFFNVLYGDADGQTLGPGGDFPESGNAGKIGCLAMVYI